MTQLNMVEALNKGLHQAMAADDRVDPVLEKKGSPDTKRLAGLVVLPRAVAGSRSVRAATAAHRIWSGAVAESPPIGLPDRAIAQGRRTLTVPSSSRRCPTTTGRAAGPTARCPCRPPACSRP